ncbi:glycoside hydrolase family 43 protein [Glycomyces harbinensis]|uniref:Carbohydrate binding module (Family 6) n=1 Tax=Glycomyces harbinensis TaxID=58114 RepID=A0A1G7ALQ9_9ACTN|nr:glycoside hydrolase family 43 protein [Glycomyces harbinensis]SDE15683.1 Carbohydrate binding module (family 6) [Glycomyces harbinensis]
MSTPNRSPRRLATLAITLASAFLAATLSAVADPSPSPVQADNPIVQTIYTADPAPLVHNGRVYLYTGHDEDGSTWFTMKEWRVWSSDDMVNWTDHGSPLNIDTFSWARQDAWAGQAVERNGKFYWYVPVINDATGRNAIGVAVADSPTGPFRDAIGRPLIDNAEIDPTVFIDTDGQAYLYWGNPNLWYVKLNADMTSYSGSPAKIPLTTQGFGTRPGGTDRPTLYEEGPWVYKRGSLYYNVFAAQCCSEFIAYSTAPGPTGPWTYRGTVMPAQGSSFTNHAGVIDFKGGSYFFYHNGALPGGGGFTRSVAVEKFTYNADGTIPTINMTTGGAPQVGSLNPYVRQEAETIAWGTGVETEPASGGGMNVGWIENGDSIKVEGAAFGTGASSFTARVASATAGGTIELRLDGPNGTRVGTCSVSGTGGWQNWANVTCPVSGATGNHDLYLKFTGGSGYLYNVDWWQFTA